MKFLGSAPPAELLAQPRAWRLVERIEPDKGGHAWLLTGAPGNGPLATAEWLAEQMLIPANASPEVIAGVERRVQRRVHPDLIWIRAEGNQISNDQIDSIAEQISRMPFEADAQVVVIEDASSLGATNPQTANRLLKTLEEPTGTVVFLLVVDRADLVLPTIRSRTAEISFPPLSLAAAHHILEEAASAGQIAPGPEQLGRDVLVRIGAGDASRLRALAAGGDDWERYRGMVEGAIELAAGRLDPDALAGWMLGRATYAFESAGAAARAEFEALAESMAPKDAQKFRSESNPAGLEKRSQRRARSARSNELAALMRELSLVWRDLMALSVGASDDVLICADRVSALRELAGSHAAVRAVASLDAIEETAARLRGAADESLAVTALMTELAGLARGRIRARRTLGAPTRTPTGVTVDLG